MPCGAPLMSSRSRPSETLAVDSMRYSAMRFLAMAYSNGTMMQHPVVLIGRMYHPDGESRLRAQVPLEILESPLTVTVRGPITR